MASGATDRIAVIGLIIAVYGAVLASVNSTLQLLAHIRDRADVILKIRKNMSVAGSSRYGDMKLTIVTATNRGKRPVTIQGFSTKLLDTNEEYLLGDIRPRLPHQINEGEEVAAFVNEAGGDLNYVESFYVWDSVGRHFLINLVPWHRRLVSRFLRQFAPVERIRT